MPHSVATVLNSFFLNWCHFTLLFHSFRARFVISQCTKVAAYIFHLINFPARDDGAKISGRWNKMFILVCVLLQMSLVWERSWHGCQLGGAESSSLFAVWLMGVRTWAQLALFAVKGAGGHHSRECTWRFMLFNCQWGKLYLIALRRLSLYLEQGKKAIHNDCHLKSWNICIANYC